MTNDELIAMLSALRRYGVETYEVGLSGPKVKFFAPQGRADTPETLEPSETGQPKPGLSLRDLLWSTPEWSGEDQKDEAP